MGDASGIWVCIIAVGEGGISLRVRGVLLLISGNLVKLSGWGKIGNKDRESVASREMKDLELFIFNKNLVFETVYYKGMLKILLLFEIFLCLYQFQMKG